MKAWIFLISLTAAGATWWWQGRRGSPSLRRSARERLKVVTRSFIAGVGTYFVLMAIALLYLMMSDGSP